MFLCSYNLSPDFTVADLLDYDQQTVYKYFDHILIPALSLSETAG